MKKFVKSRIALQVVMASVIAAFIAASVVSATTIGSNISTGGTLSVTGASTLTGDTSVAGTLTVTGATTLSTASSTGTVKFPTINSDTGSISFGDENLSTTGTLTVTGANTFYGATSIGGALTATSTVSFQGDSTFGNANTDVNLFTGTLQASTTALFTATSTFYSTLSMAGAKAIVLGSSAAGAGIPNTAGSIYYDSTNSVVKLGDGTNWFTVGTTTSGISLNGNQLQLADLTTQYLALGTTTQTGLSVLTVAATSTTAIPLSIRGIASHAANLFQIQNNAGTEVFAIDKNGYASSTIMSLSGDLYVGGRATTTASSGNIATQGDLSVTGTLTVSGDTSLATASSTGTVKFSTINSDTGAISFGNENLTTTGTINSATTTIAAGDLIVDTDTLVVDESADRVGISSSTPSADLAVGTGTTATTSLDFAKPCFRMTADDGSTVLYYWPSVAAGTLGGWATSTTSCF